MRHPRWIEWLRALNDGAGRKDKRETPYSFVYWTVSIMAAMIVYAIYQVIFGTAGH